MITACSILFVASCLPDNRVTSGNANEISERYSNLPSGSRLVEIDPYESTDDWLETEMKKILPKLGLSRLPNTVRPGEFKFRIWTNLGGLADPKLFEVHFNGVVNEAYLFTINREAYAKSRKNRLADPKSGWNKMIFELKSGLTTPRGLVRDPQFSLQRDEPLIVLEVVEREEYSRVFYGKHTSFPDGKRLIDACEYLAGEFDIEMDCRTASMTLR